VLEFLEFLLWLGSPPTIYVATILLALATWLFERERKRVEAV